MVFRLCADEIICSSRDICFMYVCVCFPSMCMYMCMYVHVRVCVGKIDDMYVRHVLPCSQTRDADIIWHLTPAKPFLFFLALSSDILSACHYIIIMASKLAPPLTTPSAGHGGTVLLHNMPSYNLWIAPPLTTPTSACRT